MTNKPIERLPPLAAADLARLNYPALALGDIGSQVRDELVRKPWLTEREKLELIGSVSAEYGDTTAADLAYEEGEDEGSSAVKTAVRELLCDADGTEADVRAALESIRMEVA